MQFLASCQQQDVEFKFGILLGFYLGGGRDFSFLILVNFPLDTFLPTWEFKSKLFPDRFKKNKIRIAKCVACISLVNGQLVSFSDFTCIYTN